MLYSDRSDISHFEELASVFWKVLWTAVAQSVGSDRVRACFWEDLPIDGHLCVGRADKHVQRSASRSTS